MVTSTTVTGTLASFTGSPRRDSTFTSAAEGLIEGDVTAELSGDAVEGPPASSSAPEIAPLPQPTEASGGPSHSVPPPTLPVITESVAVTAAALTEHRPPVDVQTTASSSSSAGASAGSCSRRAPPLLLPEATGFPGFGAATGSIGTETRRRLEKLAKMRGDSSDFVHFFYDSAMAAVEENALERLELNSTWARLEEANRGCNQRVQREREHLEQGRETLRRHLETAVGLRFQAVRELAAAATRAREIMEATEAQSQEALQDVQQLSQRAQATMRQAQDWEQRLNALHDREASLAQAEEHNRKAALAIDNKEKELAIVAARQRQELDLRANALAGREVELKDRETALAERELALAAREASVEATGSLKQRSEELTKELDDAARRRDRLHSELIRLGCQLERTFRLVSPVLEKYDLGEVGEMVDQQWNTAAVYAHMLEEAGQLLHSLPAHIDSAALAAARESAEAIVRGVLVIVKTRFPDLNLDVLHQGVDPGHFAEATKAVGPTVEALLQYLRPQHPARRSDDDDEDEEWPEAPSDPKGKGVASSSVAGSSSVGGENQAGTTSGAGGDTWELYERLTPLPPLGPPPCSVGDTPLGKGM